MDSGASYHTVSMDSLSKEELKTLRRLPEPIIMETANGDTETNDEADIFVEELDMYVTAIVIRDYYISSSFCWQTCEGPRDLLLLDRHGAYLDQT